MSSHHSRTRSHSRSPRSPHAQASGHRHAVSVAGSAGSSAGNGQPGGQSRTTNQPPAGLHSTGSASIEAFGGPVFSLAGPDEPQTYGSPNTNTNSSASANVPPRSSRRERPQQRAHTVVTSSRSRERSQPLSAGGSRSGSRDRTHKHSMSSVSPASASQSKVNFDDMLKSLDEVSVHHGARGPGHGHSASVSAALQSSSPSSGATPSARTRRERGGADFAGTSGEKRRGGNTNGRGEYPSSNTKSSSSSGGGGHGSSQSLSRPKAPTLTTASGVGRRQTSRERGSHSQTNSASVTDMEKSIDEMLSSSLYTNGYSATSAASPRGMRKSPTSPLSGSAMASQPVSRSGTAKNNTNLGKLDTSSTPQLRGTNSRMARRAQTMNDTTSTSNSSVSANLEEDDNVVSPTSGAAGLSTKIGNWFNFSRKTSSSSIQSGTSLDSMDSAYSVSNQYPSTKRESIEARIARLDPNDPNYDSLVQREKERERKYRIAQLEHELAADEAKDRANRDQQKLEEREQEIEKQRMEREVKAQEEAEERRKDREFSGYDKDINKLRREQKKIHQDRANADRKELELIAAARQKEGDTISRKAVVLILPGQADERSLDPEYIKAVISFLKKDNLMPSPENFLSSDGFEFYMDTVGMTFGEILGDYLDARFLKRPLHAASNSSTNSGNKDTFDPVDIKFSVVEARGLQAKEGRSRDAYCCVELGEIPPDGSDAFIKWDKRKDRTVFNTQPKPQTLNPKWNQHIPIQCTTLMDSIMIDVLDSGKEQFLGRVRLSYAEIITAAAREGRFKRWIPLQQAFNKSKDKNKYVGGELLVVAEIKDKYGGLGTTRDHRRPGELTREEDPVVTLHKELVQTSLDFRAMYRTLLRGCLNLDMRVLRGKIDDSTFDLLSKESKTILKILGRSWRVSDAYMVIAYVELIYDKYCEAGKAPLIAVLSAYERLKEDIRSTPQAFEGHDSQSVVDVLNKMYKHFKDQLCKYKEFFPKNQPKGALETTILIMRMIYKNRIFIEAHRDLPPSFRDELKNLLTEAAITRYNKLKELTAPFDEQNVESVVNGIMALAEQVCNEIEDDAKYFKAPFQRELDIVRLTAETYLKYFVLTLENNTDVLAQEEAVLHAGKAVFDLYKMVQLIEERYVIMVPGLKRLSMNAGFSVERWFAPFVVSWLEHLSKRTLEWVSNAVHNDNWQPLDESTVSERHHSSSIKDVFSAIYQELDFVMGLRWSHPVQNSGFLQLFSRSLNSAMDQYCNAISEGEINKDTNANGSGPLGSGINWRNYAWQGARKGGVAPVDISSVTCIKLCNIEYAMAKLDGLYKHMNAPAATKIIREYKKTMSNGKPTTQEEYNQLDTITGSFRLQIAYAEDVKAVNSGGSSNPYCVVRLPNGTEIYPEENIAKAKDSKVKKDDDEPEEEVKPLILTGSQCEVARSRVINDTINPTWDETFAIMLPPIKCVELIVLSKNLIASDDVLGTAILEMSKGTKLRRRLVDFQTHDVFVELEPQGRIMLRMTMEGSDDDIDFWFRKAKERLGRTRNDFVRHLVNRIMPYIRNTFQKALKDQEAQAVASKNFFQSLTQAQEYSDRTSTGAFVSDPMPVGEADAIIDPVIEYLNRNLATLTDFLSIRLAQEVIRRCWEDILNMMEYAMVPQLFGLVEKDRRVLNNRQISLIKFVINEFKIFFNAEGAEMGLPLKLLESRRYSDCMTLIDKYHQDLSRNKREYELELLKGKDRESLLRLIRLKVERQTTDLDYTEDRREVNRIWIEEQISRRKELARR